MRKARNGISRLVLVPLLVGVVTGGAALEDQQLLRYSRDAPEIKGLLQGIEGKPGGYGLRVATNIVGTWNALGRDLIPPSASLLQNSKMTWRSMRFTNGLVEISYELSQDHRPRQFVGTYAVVHKATEGRGNAPNIVIRSRDGTETGIMVLIGVRIGIFNWFPPDFPVLWFCDLDGHNYFFEPVKVSRQQLMNRLGAISPEEQEKTRKREMEALELKDKRITNPQTTSQAIRNLQNAKLTEHERNKEILRLMNEGDETCVPVLLEHIGANHSLVVRQNAIRALGAIRDKRAISPLIDLIRTPVHGNIEDEAEDEAILRRKAVVALGDIGDPAAFPVLKAIVQSERDYQSVRDLARITASKLEPR